MVLKSIVIWPNLKLKELEQSGRRYHNHPKDGEPPILIKNTPATKEEVIEHLLKIYPRSNLNVLR